ncbi:hypothetical protein MMC18_001032 [Xylographa bjoerkii]|nr:hypothetical protein [Xylographa bjoerkii]
MAFSSQFALSYGLDKLLPVVPFVNFASEGLLELVRVHKRSGSDLPTEYELAHMLGRNKINAQFGNSFKTAIRQSTVVRRVYDIAELVLEAGAGPTVEHSISRIPFSSMVIQVSLLLWSHQIDSLVKGVGKLIQRGTQVKQMSLPSSEALLGTFRSIRQQTSGYPWELVFAAVEETLKAQLNLTSSQLSRSIPLPVLQVLAGGTSILQSRPGFVFLAIRTLEGLSTIVVWVHNILGLTVEIKADRGSTSFGHGPAAVVIDCKRDNGTFLAEAAILNETQDVKFQVVSKPMLDPPLRPAMAHTLKGYGSKYVQEFLGFWSSDVEDELVSQKIVSYYMSICLAIAENYKTSKQRPLHRRTDEHIPSRQRIFEVGKMLFPGFEISSSSLHDQDARKGHSNDEIRGIPHDGFWGSNDVKFRTMRALQGTIFALSAVDNLKDCEMVPLNINSSSKYDDYRCLTMSNSFMTLASLLSDETLETGDLTKAGVISGRGWSLCMSSIVSSDPESLRPGLTILQGVPSREGERRECIRDSQDYSYSDSLVEPHSGCTIVAGPGSTSHISCYVKGSETAYHIGMDDRSFWVHKTFACLEDTPQRRDIATIRAGFRLLQVFYWATCPLPECNHSVETENELTLTPQTYVFAGLCEQITKSSLKFRKALRITGAADFVTNTEGTEQVDAPGTVEISSDEDSSTDNDSSLDDHSTSSGQRDSNDEQHLGLARVQPSSAAGPLKTHTPSVYISLSSNNLALRWILLSNLRNMSCFDAVYLKHSKCCIPCSIAFIQSRTSGKIQRVALIT